MVLFLYMLASLGVFFLALGPLLTDPTRPIYRSSSWGFLALAMVLSPVTLPNMLLKRLQKATPARFY